jgi:hypothetical protein
MKNLRAKVFFAGLCTYLFGLGIMGVVIAQEALTGKLFGNMNTPPLAQAGIAIALIGMCIFGTCMLRGNQQ